MEKGNDDLEVRREVGLRESLYKIGIQRDIKIETERRRERERERERERKREREREVGARGEGARRISEDRRQIKKYNIIISNSSRFTSHPQLFFIWPLHTGFPNTRPFDF